MARLEEMAPPLNSLLTEVSHIECQISTSEVYMIRTMAVCFLTLAINNIVLSGLSGQSEEDALRAELGRVFEALSTGDIEFFDEHYVAEVTRFHMRGQLDIGWDAEKSAGMKASFAEGWRYHTESYEVADLRIYGNFAITAGTGITTRTTRDGRTVGSNFRFTYVWTKQGGRWKELHHHISPGAGNSSSR
jgi:ketosteroid isomerase-like protein